MFEMFRKYHRVVTAMSGRKDNSMKLLKDIPSNHPNLRNRKIYLEKIGVSPSRIVSAQIVHGGNVSAVSEKDAGKIIPESDGLIAQSKNIYLSVTSADCLPIFLFESEKKIAGIVHAGWRSLAKNILSNAVGKITGLGGLPGNILAGIGPAICQKHYEVGPEVAEKFAKYPEAIQRIDKKIYLDIKKIAEMQFVESGLKEKNIETSPECTFEMPEKYFSARREKPPEVEAMISVIGIKK